MKLPISAPFNDLSLSTSDTSPEPIADQVDRFFQRTGIALPMQPLDEKGQPISPQLTQDITKLSSQRLGHLLAQTTACADYATFVASMSDMQLTEATQEFELTWAKVRLEKEGTIADRDNCAKIDPRVIKAQRVQLERLAIARLTAVVAKNYERDISAISREITRRTSEMNRRDISGA